MIHFPDGSFRVVRATEDYDYSATRAELEEFLSICYHDQPIPPIETKVAGSWVPFTRDGE